LTTGHLFALFSRDATVTHRHHRFSVTVDACRATRPRLSHDSNTPRAFSPLRCAPASACAYPLRVAAGAPFSACRFTYYHKTEGVAACRNSGRALALPRHLPRSAHTENVLVGLYGHFSPTSDCFTPLLRCTLDLSFSGRRKNRKRKKGGAGRRGDRQWRLHHTATACLS